MLKLLKLLPLSLLLFSGCEKEIEGCLDPATEPQEAAAEVVWTGPIAADGCEFFIQIGDNTYKPQNEEVLPEAYKKPEPTPILLSYTQPQAKIQYPCGVMGNAEFNALRIHGFKPR